MTLPIVEDAYGDPRNAVAMSLASDLAYLPEAQGAEGFRNELGLEAKLFSVGNTQAYVATNDDHIVVAFRGTEAPTSIEGLKDWLLTDAVNLLMVPEGRLGTDLAAAGVGARFHQGFVNAIADIWEPVYGAVDAEMKKAERPLWVTGHSLGGALALFAAWLFVRKMINVHQVYTFGAPMIGNLKAIEAFDREFPNKIFRYVNSPDPVPQLPLMSLLSNEYGHCQKEIGVGETVAATAFFGDLAGKAVDGLLNATLIDEIWASLQGRISAHGMDNYRQLVAKLFK
ncbi:MAG: lipase family protein [Gemmataceae bacterium]